MHSCVAGARLGPAPEASAAARARVRGTRARRLVVLLIGLYAARLGVFSACLIVPRAVEPSTVVIC